jgi:hypothetical protein
MLFYGFFVPSSKSTGNHSKSILEKTITPWRYTKHHLSLVKNIYGLVDLDELDPNFF